MEIIYILVAAVVGILAINEFSSWMVFGNFLPKSKEDYLLSLIEQGTYNAPYKMVHLHWFENDRFENDRFITHGFVSTQPTPGLSKWYWSDENNVKYQIPRWSKVHREIEKLAR